MGNNQSWSASNRKLMLDNARRRAALEREKRSSSAWKPTDGGKTGTMRRVVKLTRKTAAS